MGRIESEFRWRNTAIRDMKGLASEAFHFGHNIYEDWIYASRRQLVRSYCLRKEAELRGAVERHYGFEAGGLNP